MEVKTLILFLFIAVCSTPVKCSSSKKKPVSYNMTKIAAKYDNPGFIRDRYKWNVKKPVMPEWWANRHKLPFNPEWMDYCDPYHCSNFHKIVCGLNRYKMKFKWFQSQCHLALNNQCATYRGFLKYDLIEYKFCYKYVMFLRNGCPSKCHDEKHSPVCGMSMTDRHVVMFKNQCAMERANCNMDALNDYEEVTMGVCNQFELYKI